MIKKYLIIGIIVIAGIILLIITGSLEFKISLIGCRTYFDGCNTCEVVNGFVTSCTELGCPAIREEPRCLEKKSNPSAL